MALGAQSHHILRLIVGRGLVLVAAGIALGLLASFGVSSMLGSLLFGVSTKDPVTFVTVPLVLGAMAVLASYIPALRATRTDPMLALRQE
jgi:ABC-type antimicrobial peptide transport system permease subunit